MLNVVLATSSFTPGHVHIPTRGNPGRQKKPALFAQLWITVISHGLNQRMLLPKTRLERTNYNPVNLESALETMYTVYIIHHCCKLMIAVNLTI